MIELTEKRLNIPKALAVKYARVGTDLYDSLISEGNLALCEAANNPAYDPSLSSEDTYLYNAVQWAMRNYIDPTRRRKGWKDDRFLRIDDEMPPADGTSPPDVALAVADEVEASMRRLTTVERKLFQLRHAEGLTLDEIAVRLGLSRQAISQRTRKIDAKVRASAKCRETRRGTHLVAGPIGEWRKKNPSRSRQLDIVHAAKGRVQYVQNCMEMRLLGVVLASEQYLVDHARRLIAGGFRNVRAAIDHVGIRPARYAFGAYKSAWLGWPEVEPVRAECLDAMAAAGGVVGVADLMAATGRSCKSVSDSVQWSVRNGYVETVRAASPGYRPVAGLYRIAKGTLDRQGEVCRLVILQGKDVKKFEADGYRVVPPHTYDWRAVATNIDGSTLEPPKQT